MLTILGFTALGFVAASVFLVWSTAQLYEENKAMQRNYVQWYKERKARRNAQQFQQLPYVAAPCSPSRAVMLTGAPAQAANAAPEPAIADPVTWEWLLHQEVR